MSWVKQGELARRYYAEMSGFLTASVTEYTNGIEFSNSSGPTSMINGTDRLVAPIDGIYLIGFDIAWEHNTTGSRSALIFRWRGGPTQIADIPAVLNPADVTMLSVVFPAPLLAGDLISFGSYQGSGATLAISRGRCSLTRITP